MASTSVATSRRARRILQACENCRRKKTRCPGERPRCTNCTRLGQTCRYPVTESISVEDETLQISHTATQPSYVRRLEERLARLEGKLEAVLDKQSANKGHPSPRQAETPRSTSIIDTTAGVDDTGLSLQSPAPRRLEPRDSVSRMLPSTAAVEQAIRIYFRCSHRQPIWLFEPPSSLSSHSAEAILLCVLALSVQYDPNAFSNELTATMETPQAYNDAARSIIMYKVANSTVDMATLQALCLLVFSNLVCGDLQLASFHVMLVGSLLQFSGLDTHTSQDRTPPLECQRRLFWSVQTVRVLCGSPIKIPSTYDIKAPCFLAPQETTSLASASSASAATARRAAIEQAGSPAQAAPLLPLDLQNNSRSERSVSIWMHMVRSASIWSLVRVYVWRCCHGQTTRAPWQPDSDYTAINAQLLDMECAFPPSFRYDSASFIERPLEELLKHQDFWLPWMKIQVTYHTIHAVLNHPFLYSPRVSHPRPGPNAFWKTSTDLALLHSTWIARLIGMAKKKELPLADPFFVYSAAVAITLHLYWSRASDPTIRAAAVTYLEVCRSFITGLASRWPVCRSIQRDVEKLVQLSSSSRREGPPSTTLSDNISLMWRILDFGAMQQPNSPIGQSLFQPSLGTHFCHRAASPEDMAPEDPEVESPPDDFQTSVGNYASAPDWFSPPIVGDVSPARENDTAMRQGTDDGHSMESASTIVDLAVPNTNTNNMIQMDTPPNLETLSGLAWDNNINDSTTLYDPFAQLFGRGGHDSRWWGGGNL